MLPCWKQTLIFYCDVSEDEIGILGNSGQVLGNSGQNQWKQAATSLGSVNKIQDTEAPPVVSGASKEYAHLISGISLMLASVWTLNCMVKRA